MGVWGWLWWAGQGDVVGTFVCWGVSWGCCLACGCGGSGARAAVGGLLGWGGAGVWVEVFCVILCVVEVTLVLAVHLSCKQAGVRGDRV